MVYGHSGGGDKALVLVPGDSGAQMHLPGIAVGVHRVKVHPVVVLSVLDHFMRRSEENENQRVIGTLLGVVSEGGDVEVRSAFPVPHTEVGDQPMVDIDFHHTMFELHQRANPKEIIVGWYATGNSIPLASSLIHEFYGKEIRATLNKELQHPVHLTIDTTLTNNRMNIQAYTSANIGAITPEGPQGFMFLPIVCELKLPESERIGLDLVTRAKTAPNRTTALLSDLDNLEGSVQSVRDLLDTAQKYVDGVIKGNVQPDVNVGRQLMDAVASLPKIDHQQFEQMFNSNLQDLLMVVFLSNLTRTQLAVAERLQSIL